MSNLIELVQEADFALLEIEQSRIGMEAAKVAFELAKNDHERAKATFEEVISRADEVGVSRVKLRKIIEERAAVLSASGLMSVPVNKMGSLKTTEKAQRSSGKPTPKTLEKSPDKAPAKAKGKRSASADGAGTGPTPLNA